MNFENSNVRLTNPSTNHNSRGNEYGDIAISGNAVALLGNGTIVVQKPLAEAADGHRDGTWTGFASDLH